MLIEHIFTIFHFHIHSQGDSGSPLMFFDNKKLQWVLTGIVSFGQKKCGTEGYPAVYVNVTNYLPWIEHTITGHGDDQETVNFS